MKKIEAIVRVDKLHPVKVALEEAGYPGLTVTEVRGHGNQKGITEIWRGRTFKVDLLPKVKMEIVVPDENVAKLVDTITSVARTGSIGDGKIFVSNIEEVVRIRTGEKGKQAV
jgi:nitrogen regulatory protein P-II 1